MGLKGIGQQLTPYAVQPRYDGEFWPSLADARAARDAACAIKQFVAQRLPPHLVEGTGNGPPPP